MKALIDLVMFNWPPTRWPTYCQDEFSYKMILELSKEGIKIITEWQWESAGLCHKCKGRLYEGTIEEIETWKCKICGLPFCINCGN